MSIFIIKFCISIKLFIKPKTYFGLLTEAIHLILLLKHWQIVEKLLIMHHEVFYFIEEYFSKMKPDFQDRTFRASILYDLLLINSFLSFKLIIVIFFWNNYCSTIQWPKIIDIFLNILIKFIEDLRIILCLLLEFFYFKLPNYLISAYVFRSIPAYIFSPSKRVIFIYQSWS